MSEMTNPNEPAAIETPPAPEGAKARKRKKNAAAPSGEPPRSGADRGGSRRASSDVGALTTLAIAIPFYGLALWGAKAAPPGARAILLERGWPPHATMILTALAIAILIVKAFGLRRQRRAFALDLLPDAGSRIVPSAAARLVAHVESIRGRSGARSFLVERVLRVLSQYAAHGDVAEANAANDADADADASSVAASFSTVKVLVWAMPILGLIGTVVGLSGAVGAFSHAMSGADQLDTIKDSLREVTTGLAVAFDATFVALVASILVMLPMTWLQKAEDKLVNDVDDYCVTHILAHLGGSASAPAEKAPEIRSVIADALAQPLAEMLAANTRVMDRLSEDRAAVSDAQGALVAQLAAFTATLQQVMPAVECAAGQLEQATAAIGPNVERATAELGRATAQMAEVSPSVERAASHIERAVTQLEATTAQMHERVAPSVERAAHQIERAVTQLEATTAVADQAASAAERAQDQLSRELGASRQLLSLLAAGLGANDASIAKPRHANGTNGAGAARGG